MSRTPRFCFLPFLVALLFSAAPPSRADAPDEAEVRKLVEQLAGDNARARAEAARKLTALGPAVLPALRKIVRDPRADPDGRLRVGLVVRAIEAQLFREVRRFDGHTGAVRYLAVSPDGKHVLSCSGWPRGSVSVPCRL